MIPPSDPEPSERSTAAESMATSNPSREFVVAGVGASAGGLEAISALLKQLPVDAKLALVVVQHLGVEHESLLVELLGRVSHLPVRWAEHGRSVTAGNVYVAPAKSVVTIKNGVLLVDEDGRRTDGVINRLFRSLAQEMKHRAVGVILSGTGMDGVAGLKAIKGAGGIVFAQKENTAAFAAMPRAAIDAGCVDTVLPPAEIANELVRLTQSLDDVWRRLPAGEEMAAGTTEADLLTAIYRVLAARTGVDFSDYKQSTIKRRLVRRMLLVKTPELASYLKLLQRSREEVDLLYESLLINVTEFFRDPECFDFLQACVLPALIDQHADGSPIRIWVPGCASGEEVYSLGIAMRETLEAKGHHGPVQIFGTDVSDHMVTMARAGIFSAADMANVSPERRRQFFYETERGYVIAKPIRDLCIFAQQNVVKDSPFSRLDLISCRNLLIYLGPKLQRKLMPMFHYALNPSGCLVLGSSESIGTHADFFRLVDRRHRIYSRKSTSHRVAFEFPLERTTLDQPTPLQPTSIMPGDSPEPFDVIREADRIVLNRHAPTGVLVNEELDILQFRGDVSPYLAPLAGRASLNLLKMARDGLAMELEAALKQAREKNARVRCPGVMVHHGRETHTVEIDITPVDAMQTTERFYLVLFTPGSETRVAPAKGKAPTQETQLEQLRQELNTTRNYLHATIEKHEATNQELRAANEEIQSSNEELQSTNEELETAKEELQSTNEELTTVNEELHSRQLELIQVNNDLTNLINSVHLPIIILGQDMRIRRFTPMAEQVLNVIPTDVGRPLSDININLNVPNLAQLMAKVIDSLTVREQEVQDRHGRWYSMRLRPYKTADNKIDGVVITLIDIDQIKVTMAQLQETRDFAEAIVETTPEPLAALTADLRIKSANEAFYRLFKTTKERAQEHSFFEAVNEPGKLGDLRRALEGILPMSAGLTNHQVGIDLPGTGPTQLLISVRHIACGPRSYPLLLLTLRKPD
jgi:two-component system, chemotaxis family, CheB/CheR fusion protein